jgi:hypothetical protein
MPRFGKSDGVPLVLNQHFHQHNGRLGPRIRGTVAVEVCHAQPPVGAPRSDLRHEDFYPASEKLSFVKPLKDHEILATHPTGGA